MPDVGVAVTLTPISAGVYVTPDIVTAFAPFAIVPVSVPPNVPVPVFKLKVTSVAAVTFLRGYHLHPVIVW